MMLRKIVARNPESFFSRDGIAGNQPLHVLCNTFHKRYSQSLHLNPRWPGVEHRIIIENHVLNDFELSTPIQAFLSIQPNRNISSKIVLRTNDRGEIPLHLILKFAGNTNDPDPLRNLDSITADVRLLTDANIDCTAILDKSENLYPFMLAAATFDHDKNIQVSLSLIFELLLKFVSYHELTYFSTRIQPSTTSTEKTIPKENEDQRYESNMPLYRKLYAAITVHHSCIYGSYY